ncbi:MAG: hypothetical protein ACOCXH_05220 [Cyclobacteriaceae bacterium]
MKKIIIVSLLLVFVAATQQEARAQYYSTSLGLKFGGYNGISAKHFISDVNALEGLLSFGWGGFALTGLYEWNWTAFDTDGLSWYIGGGAHIGVRERRPFENTYYDDGSAFLGVDFILGLEYTFEEIPLNIALDWKPAFDIIGDQYFWAGDVALGARYTFQ